MAASPPERPGAEAALAPPSLPDGASWSLHRRLALGLVLSIGGVFLLLFAVLEHWIDREIYRRMDEGLHQRASVVARLLQEPGAQPLAQWLPEYASQGHTEFFTVFERDAVAAAPLLHSPSSAGQALPLGPLEEGTPRWFNVVLPDGHAGRAMAVPLPAYAGQPGAHLLVLASERESWDRTERRIHFALLLGIVLATALATGLALWQVQRVVRVLQRAGDALAALRSDQVVAPMGADFPRELRPFADTFNLGLHHLYAAIARERRFSRDVAHELRTPIAEIRISAESALADTDPALAQRSLHAAVAACTRMQRSIDTLLLLARLEAGQHPAAPDPLDLAQLMRDLLAAVQRQADERQLHIHAPLPAAAWVQADLGIVERIVSNLLRNAVEYTPEGGAITCQLERSAQGWWLSLRNPAPSLEAADLQQLGRRFWRKQPEGGTSAHAGLGLALVMALAQAVQWPLHFELEHGCLVVRLGPWPALL